MNYFDLNDMGAKIMMFHINDMVMTMNGKWGGGELCFSTNK